jgi:hypothetical protein
MAIASPEKAVAKVATTSPAAKAEAPVAKVVVRVVVAVVAADGVVNARVAHNANALTPKASR